MALKAYRNYNHNDYWSACLNRLFYFYNNAHEEFLSPLIVEVKNQLTKTTSTRGQTPAQKSDKQDEQSRVAIQLLSALYQAHVAMPIGTQVVSVPLATQHYSGNEAYPYRAVKKAFDTLVSLNWISVTKGSESSRKVTRIKAKGFLASQFEDVGLKWTIQQPLDPESLVIVKDFENPQGASKGQRGVKVVITTPETQEVKEWQDNLALINRFLCSHCFSLGITDEQLDALSQVMRNAKKSSAKWRENNITTLDFSRVQLYRVFSRGSLSKGGRFYGGWWQSVPSAYRGHILIDGNKTIELDYSSMALSCLYGISDAEFDQSDDLYDLGLHGWMGGSDPRRPIIKEFINSLLNDDTKRYRLKDADSKLIDMKHQDLLALVIKKHPILEPYLYSGYGLDLQFLDSQIAESIMLKLIQNNIAVLPIHDSFIVRLGYQDKLRDAMRETFNDLVNKKAKVKSSPTKNQSTFGMLESEISILEHDINFGIETPLQLGESGELFKFTIMERYLASWRHRKRLT